MNVEIIEEKFHNDRIKQHVVVNQQNTVRLKMVFVKNSDLHAWNVVIVNVINN